MSIDCASEIKAAERQRCAAMIANDPAALAAVLDDALQFHHSNGLVDDKPAFLAKLAAGRIRYTGIAWSEEIVTALGGDAAMLTGRMITNVAVEGVDRQLNNRVLTVWRSGNDAWRLLAFQSTPIAG